MSRPFFSLVMPTKNRAAILGHSIRSLLAQTFTDFEIVVADNDDTDATERALAAFSDPRLTRVRTGNLSMSDNWEAGFDRATGEYVCMLEDKQALKRRALERVHREILRHDRPRVVKWRYDVFDNSESPYRVRLAKTVPDGARMIASDELLERFCTSLADNYKGVLPLPQLGAFHRELADVIRANAGGRLFHAVSPDVVMGLLALNFADEVLDVPESLGVYTSSTHSNGDSSTVRGALFQSFMRELGISENRLYDLVPLKIINVPVCIFNDFRHLRARVKGRLARYDVGWVKFFVEARTSMRQAEGKGFDIAPDLRAWKEALAAQEASVQSDVAVALKGGRPTRGPWRRRLQRAVEVTGFPRLKRHFKAFVRGRLLGQTEWRFSSVDDYLEWDGRRHDAERPVATQASRP